MKILYINKTFSNLKTKFILCFNFYKMLNYNNIFRGLKMKFLPAVVTCMFLLLLITCTKKQDGGENAATSDANSKTLPTEFQPLIGLEFGPDSFPSEFEEHTGYVLGFMEENEYIIDHVSRGTTQLVWFCKLTKRDKQGRPYLKILDIFVLPPMENDEQLLMGTCNFQTQSDPEIIAIAKFIKSEARNEIRLAWRANRSKQQFEEVSPSLVECYDESFYL